MVLSRPDVHRARALHCLRDDRDGSVCSVEMLRRNGHQWIRHIAASTEVTSRAQRGDIPSGTSARCVVKAIVVAFQGRGPAGTHTRICPVGIMKAVQVVL